MKKLIYYPNFEPPNTEWLKFSLLYLDRLESIVPNERQHLISDDYRWLLNETDLLEMYSPSYNESERASIKAVEEALKFIDNPDLRSSLFNRPNILRDWRSQDKWNYNIFSEKFSNSFSDFVLRNQIGKRTEDGLILPKELAFIFMTYLAQEISTNRNGSIITDNIEFDHFTNYSKVINPSINNRHKFMKGIVNMILPGNLADIPLERLIDFRNKNREKILSFNNQINLFEDSIGKANAERDFINSFNDIYSELAKEILLLGIGIASIPFATYILIQNQNALIAEYIKETLGGIGLGLGGIYTIKRALFDNKEKRQCKKYIANLTRLK